MDLKFNFRDIFDLVMAIMFTVTHHNITFQMEFFFFFKNTELFLLSSSVVQ